MRARGAVAFAVALVAFLCVGLWLGGHPGEAAGLPPRPLRRRTRRPDRRSGGSDRGQLLPPGRRDRARQLLAAGDGPGAAQAPPRPLLRILLAGKPGKLQPADRRPLLGDRAQRRPGQARPAGRPGLPRLAGRTRPGSKPATRSSPSTATRSPARAATEATKQIKGPEGTEVTVGVRDAKTGKVARADPDPGRGGAAQRQQPGRRRSTAASSATSACSASAKASTRCSPTPCRKVEREGAEGIVLDLRGNPGGLLDEAVLSASVFLPEGEVVVSTKSRTQGDSVHKTVGGDLPKLPLVVLIDRNTASAAEILTAALADDAGATVVGTRSFGKGVFQEEREPRQRRRPEADGRRILHPGRRQPGPQPRHPPRREGQRRPGDGGRRGASSGRWGCWRAGPAAERAGAAGARRDRRRGRGRGRAARPRATRSRRCCASGSASAASAPRSRSRRRGRQPRPSAIPAPAAT